jgi:hypothetical protein
MQHRSFALFGFDLASCLALETSQKKNKKQKTKNKKQKTKTKQKSRLY